MCLRLLPLALAVGLAQGITIAWQGGGSVAWAHGSDPKVFNRTKEAARADIAAATSSCTTKANRGEMIKQTLKSDGTGMAYYGTQLIGNQPVSTIYDTGSWDYVVLSSCKHGTVQSKCCAPEACPHAGYSPPVSSSCYGVESLPGPPEVLKFGSGDIWTKKVHDTISIPGESDGAANSEKSRETASQEKATEVEEEEENSSLFGRLLSWIWNFLRDILPVELGGHTEAVFKSKKTKAASLDIPRVSLNVVVESRMGLLKDSPLLQAVFGIGRAAAHPGLPLESMGVQRFMICFDVDPLKDGFITFNDEDRSSQSEWLAVDTIGAEDDWFTGFWIAEGGEWVLKGHGYNGQGIGCDDGCAAVIDSGSTYITAPRYMVDDLKEQITNITDCSDLSKFPTITFTLGDQQISLPPEAYIVEVVGTHNLLEKPSKLAMHMLPLTKEDRAKHMQAQQDGRRPSVKACALMFSAENVPETTDWGELLIIGMPILRKYAVQFDTSNTPAKMRFAEADAHCTSYGSSSKKLQFSRQHGASDEHFDRWTHHRNTGKVLLPKFDPFKDQWSTTSRNRAMLQMAEAFSLKRKRARK